MTKAQNDPSSIRPKIQNDPGHKTTQSTKLGIFSKNVYLFNFVAFYDGSLWAWFFFYYRYRDISINMFLVCKIYNTIKISQKYGALLWVHKKIIEAKHSNVIWSAGSISIIMDQENVPPPGRNSGSISITMDQENVPPDGTLALLVPSWTRKMFHRTEFWLYQHHHGPGKCSTGRNSGFISNIMDQENVPPDGTLALLVPSWTRKMFHRTELWLYQHHHGPGKCSSGRNSGSISIIMHQENVPPDGTLALSASPWTRKMFHRTKLY